MNPIDAAVDAAGTPAKQVGVRVRLSTGRILTFLKPVDMTERERLDAAAYFAVGDPDQPAKPKGRSIYVPGHLAKD
jgi:hypothetical protein